MSVYTVRVQYEYLTCNVEGNTEKLGWNARRTPTFDVRVRVKVLEDQQPRP